jgi:hypothetical protein
MPQGYTNGFPLQGRSLCALRHNRPVKSAAGTGRRRRDLREGLSRIHAENFQRKDAKVRRRKVFPKARRAGIFVAIKINQFSSFRSGATSKRTELTHRRKGVARPSRNQNQLHKEARKPGILFDGSWFPGFLTKKLHECDADARWHCKETAGVLKRMPGDLVTLC